MTPSHGVGQPELPGLHVIGVIRSGRDTPEHTPVQSALNADEIGVVELDERYADALDGLEGFDYAWLISWLGRPGDPTSQVVPLRQVPLLLSGRPREIGILATRGPRRINPIGLSLVRVIEVHRTAVTFSGVDLVDGTPILDIKPFVARFDRPDGPIRCGWFDHVELVEGATPASVDQTTR